MKSNQKKKKNSFAIQSPKGSDVAADAFENGEKAKGDSVPHMYYTLKLVPSAPPPLPSIRCCSVRDALPAWSLGAVG